MRVLRRPLPVANVCQAERDVDREEVNAREEKALCARTLRRSLLQKSINYVPGILRKYSKIVKRVKKLYVRLIKIYELSR